MQKKWTLHRIHKWVGLLAALWLAVLGISGFLLDHRDSWAWLWQSGVSPVLIPEEIEEKAAAGTYKLYRVDPNNHAYHITGGQGGLWWSSRSGQHWQRATFQNRQTMPQVYAAFFTIEDNVSILWLASDDGIWRSDDSGRTFNQAALRQQTVTSLIAGGNSHYLLGVVDRSDVFELNTQTWRVSLHDLKPVAGDELPATISLSRLVRDLHYGRGVVTAPVSLLWNDVAGIAMFVMPLTGLLFFILPRHWRKKKQQGVEINHTYKKQSIRWLFRLHAPTFGVIAFIPILYISITGIMLDHSKDLRNFMKQTQVSRTWQTPVYSLDSWQDEIYSIVTYPDKHKSFSLGTRLGLFTTNNNGETWRREKLLNNKALFIWSLERQQDEIFIGAMGGPNLYRESEMTAWRPVKGSGHMPTAMSWLSNDTWWVKTRDGLREGHIAHGFKTINMPFPQLDFIPWFYFLDGLHSGLLFHAQWKWINDLFAIMACLLVISGMIRWWNKKWI